jgi:hypothetical protein
MRIKTKSTGLFGFLFGGTDEYEVVPNDEIKNINFQTTTCSAFVGAPVVVTTNDGRDIAGLVDIDELRTYGDD